MCKSSEVADETYDHAPALKGLRTESVGKQLGGAFFCNLRSLGLATLQLA